MVVSVVHVMKGAFPGAKRLDDREVEMITAFLFHRGGHDDPRRLVANADKSFQGSIVLGMGFTFDDTDTKGVATPLSEMHRLIEKDPGNAEVIFPYIGGEEVNTSPTHAHHRYVINFGECDEDECWDRWPDLMKIVEAKVKPERAKLTKNAIGRRRAAYWWQFGSPAKELYAAIVGLDRVLVINCGATPHLAFAFLSRAMVFANTLAVVAYNTHAAFCASQSRPHEIWARFFGSSMKDDLRYTPSDCFETFPFPVPTDAQRRAIADAARALGVGAAGHARLERLIGLVLALLLMVLAMQNRAAVAAILAAVECPVQLGGGIRDRATIEAWLGAGVARVILGTAAVKNPDLVFEACRAYPGRIAVGIDAREGRVAVEGWAEDGGLAVADVATSPCTTSSIVEIGRAHV